MHESRIAFSFYPKDKSRNVISRKSSLRKLYKQRVNRIKARNKQRSHESSSEQDNRLSMYSREKQVRSATPTWTRVIAIESEVDIQSRKTQPDHKKKVPTDMAKIKRVHAQCWTEHNYAIRTVGSPSVVSVSSDGPKWHLSAEDLTKLKPTLPLKERVESWLNDTQKAKSSNSEPELPSLERNPTKIQTRKKKQRHTWRSWASGDTR